MTGEFEAGRMAARGAMMSARAPWPTRPAALLRVSARAAGEWLRGLGRLGRAFAAVARRPASRRPVYLFEEAFLGGELSRPVVTAAKVGGSGAVRPSGPGAVTVIRALARRALAGVSAARVLPSRGVGRAVGATARAKDLVSTSATKQVSASHARAIRAGRVLGVMDAAGSAARLRAKGPVSPEISGVARATMSDTMAVGDKRLLGAFQPDITLSIGRKTVGPLNASRALAARGEERSGRGWAVGGHEISVAPVPDRAAAERQGPSARPDGVTFDDWIEDRLARAAGRPPSGATGFDPRVGPMWPGAPSGF